MSRDTLAGIRGLAVFANAWLDEIRSALEARRRAIQVHCCACILLVLFAFVSFRY